MAVDEKTDRLNLCGRTQPNLGSKVYAEEGVSFTRQGGLIMVVLSRKKNEAIVINDNIIVTVVEIRGDKVRLGIENPKEIPVHRQEVWQAIHGIASPAPIPSAAPPELPKPHFEQPQPDKLDRFASALQARLSVSVSRDLVAAAMREAGIELPAGQLPSAPR
jgi:carbon storage regulator